MVSTCQTVCCLSVISVVINAHPIADYVRSAHVNGTRHGNNRSTLEQYIASYLVNETRYNWKVRPVGKNTVYDLYTNGTIKGDAHKPVHVNATVVIMSLSSFDDVLMQFQAQFRFQQEWFDERLKFDHAQFTDDDYINLALDQTLWTPDTFFQNEKNGHVHMIDRPNTYKKLKKSGWVKYNKRLTMDFSCPMHLQLFPHDNQTCVIEFSSYAYTTHDIILQWSEDAVVFHQTANKSLPKFSITHYMSGSCTSSTATGTYSCLRITMYLQREFSYFLLQLYIPSCMLVSVACVSFWIDWRAAPARVPLTIVTLLTITTQAASINANLPPVSYTKAIDIWIGACVLFIFGSLIEYSIVNYVGTNEERLKAKRSSRALMNTDFDMMHMVNYDSSNQCSPLLNKQAVHDFYGSMEDIIPPLKDPSFLFQKKSSKYERPCDDWHCSSTLCLKGPGGGGDNPAFEPGSAPILRRRYLPNAPDDSGNTKKLLSVRIVEDNNSYVSHSNGGLVNGFLGNNNHIGYGDCFDSKEYASYRRERREEIRQRIENAMNQNWCDDTFMPEINRSRSYHEESQFESLANAMKVATRAERIDMISRFMFPLGFLCFNVVYWSLYLPTDY